MNRRYGLLQVATITLSMLATGCKKSTPLPDECGLNTCNESNGGGTCDDTGGEAVCTCNVGYNGDTCTDCANGYVPMGGACLPDSCMADTCNESNGGGTCDDAGGSVTCNCNTGYVGATCRGCSAGYHPSGAACAMDVSTVCAADPGGGSGPVQMPTLIATLEASWDENWFGSPAVADLDGDGSNEIIATRHSVLYVWNQDLSPRWYAAWASSASNTPEHGSSRMWSSPVIGDFDGDGGLEIAVGSDADSSSGVNVAVYDGDGELLPGWPVQFGGSDEVRSISAGDLDGDGSWEIIVNKTSAGPTTGVYLLDGTFRPGWPQVDTSCDPPAPAEPCWDFGGYNQNVAVGDMDGDGFLDVVSSYDAIGFGIFHRDGAPFPAAAMFDDAVVTALEAYHDPALAMQGWGTGDRSEFTYSPPSLADFDGDGDLELVLAGDHEHSSDTTNQGNTVWLLHHDASRFAGWEWPIDTGPPLHYGGVGNNIVTTHPSPAIGNLDADPVPEIVVPTYDGFVHAFGAEGMIRWSYAYSSTPGGSPYVGASEAIIADLNGDGVPEVLFNTFSSGPPGMPDVPVDLIILNNNGVELLRVPLYGRGSMAAPTVWDLDGDGDLELINSLKDTLGGGEGGVQVWDIPGSFDNCLEWPTGRGSLARDGRYRGG